MKTTQTAVDRNGFPLSCGMTVLLLLTVHIEQRKNYVFHLFIFHLLSRKTKSYLYAKPWKNLHSYIDYCSLDDFQQVFGSTPKDTLPF